MKSIFIVLWFVVFGLILLMSRCTEYEILNTVDTVYLERPGQSLAPTFVTEVDTIVIRDTVEVKVIVRDTIVQQVHTTDTVYQVVTKDSVIIKETQKIIHHTDTVVVTVHDTIYNDVHHYDTIVRNVIQHDTVEVMVYDRTVVYLDTIVTVSYMRPTEYIPDDIIPHVQEFYQLCQQHGIQAPGGMIIVQYVEELPGEGWTSNSFQISENSQIVIQLDQRYPAAMHRAGMLREMARIQINKKYTQVPDRIMNPTFSPEATITTNHLNELFK